MLCVVEGWVVQWWGVEKGWGGRGVGCCLVCVVQPAWLLCVLLFRLIRCMLLFGPVEYSNVM